MLHVGVDWWRAEGHAACGGGGQRGMLHVGVEGRGACCMWGWTGGGRSEEHAWLSFFTPVVSARRGFCPPGLWFHARGGLCRQLGFSHVGGL
jgi:hypothetical protein